MPDEAITVSSSGAQGGVEVGSLVQLRIAPGRTPWRIGPAWAVAAGAVAAGVTLFDANAMLRLVAALILADLVWGILRRIVPDRPSGAGTAFKWAPSLPYARSTAPLSRFMQAVGAGERAEAVPWLGWLSGLLLAVALSLLLGPPALVLSLLATVIMLLARALVQRGNSPALCLAFLDVALPWALGVAVASASIQGEKMLWQVAALALAFTVLQWGMYRACLTGGRPAAGLWLGHGAVLGVLVVLRQPLAAAVCAVVFAPPTWWIAQRGTADDMLTRGLSWWWAAMLLTAALVR